MLRWRDIDLDGATAIITCQLQQYDGRLVLCPPKTARSERAVALDRTTVAVLRAHEAAQEAERATLGKNYHDSGYVFTCLNGDPMAPDRLSRTSQPTPARRCSPRSTQGRRGRRHAHHPVIQAGCLVPGTARPRQPEPPGYGGGGQGSGSRAHPGRQVSRPARADLDINRNRLSGNVPAQRRNAHMLLQMGSGHPAIPRPTSAHTDTLTREKIGVKPRVSTGAPPGTRTPNPRIKSGTCHSVRLRVSAAGGGYRVLPGRTGTSERTWSEPNIHADRSRPSWPRVPGPWRVKV